jgi:hypothetical protein
MSHQSWRIAPALLASLLATLAATASAHAAPAVAPDPADCLAKPNAPAQKGSHWYYHLDRPSGRHCWYQRPLNTAQSETAQPRSATPTVPPSVAAPADRPAAVTSPHALSDTGDNNRSGVPPTAASSNLSPAWPGATAAPSERMPAPAVDTAAPSPSPPPTIEPRIEAPIVEPPAAPPKHAPVRAASIERTAAPVEEPAHMPALLGTALALVIIVLGSIAVRLGSRLLRWPRRRTILAPPVSGSNPPFYGADETPGLVPVMPRHGDITREMFAPRAPAVAPPALRARPPAGEAAAAPSHEAVRVLEENVRDLLRRLRPELPAQPRGPAVPDAHAPSKAVSELDEVLAAWRGRRRNPAG